MKILLSKKREEKRHGGQSEQVVNLQQGFKILLVPRGYFSDPESSSSAEPLKQADS